MVSSLEPNEPNFIETEYIPKKAIKSLPKPKKEKTDMNKDQYKKTKAAHKAAIGALKNDIKRHKLLIKQAKLAYKIGKMKASK